jgi:hypothetical protein
MIALMADDNRRRAQIDNAHAWVAARFAGESQGRACLETYRHILRKERACG